MKITPLGKKDLPKPPKLKHLIGPSLILLGMGLGSGELILWPYLTSNFGMGIIWAAVLGITFQFFINMEIERYTLATGESIFVGLARKLGVFSPVWFIFSTLVPWIWPGIIAASAKTLAEALGYEYTKLWGIVLLFLIGLIYSAGSVIYNTQEKIQKAIIMLGIPFVFVLTLLVAKLPDWSHLARGLLGRGDGYFFLPPGISIAAFLGALAYAGAGGNLNLAQSLYAKEKGFGMGKYSGKISNFLTDQDEKISLTGNAFEENQKNVKRFRLWWKRINLEHFLVFWVTGTLAITFLSLLAYSSVFGNSGTKEGINFVINEAGYFSRTFFPALGTIFLLVVSVMLFGTQFAVLGSTSRIMVENAVISQGKIKSKLLGKIFFVFLWLQILLGSAIFMFVASEPLSLVVTGAVLNAVSMFIYTGLVLWLNLTNLPKPAKPSLVRVVICLLAFLFYGGFSAYVFASMI